MMVIILGAAIEDFVKDFDGASSGKLRRGRPDVSIAKFVATG
jgi:hypothetical protein